MDNKKRPPYASCFVIRGLDLFRASDLVLIFYPPWSLPPVQASLFLCRGSFVFRPLTSVRANPRLLTIELSVWIRANPWLIKHRFRRLQKWGPASTEPGDCGRSFCRCLHRTKIRTKTPKLANSSLCSLWLKQNPRNPCNPWLNIIEFSESSVCSVAIFYLWIGFSLRSLWLKNYPCSPF